MNVKGHGEVSSIRLKHRGCDMNFQNILEAKYMDAIPIEPSTIASIEFKDIYEVEMMINMLKKFREGCLDGMGKWVQGYETD